MRLYWNFMDQVDALKKKIKKRNKEKYVKEFENRAKVFNQTLPKQNSDIACGESPVMSIVD